MKKYLVLAVVLIAATACFGQSYGSFRDTGGGLYATQAWCNEQTQMGGGGCAVFGPDVITFSTTPVIDCSHGLVHKITLTAAVTSSTVINCKQGQPIVTQICENGTGTYTFAFPASFSGATAISTTANKCTVQQFVYDASVPQAYAVSAGVTGQ